MRVNNLAHFDIVAQSVVFWCKFEPLLGDNRNFLFLLADNIQTDFFNIVA